ncbi:MAG: FtsX-like permease family protein [Elusimicrobiota bacterium]|nr:FtsX-like permease family protein [Elusimicrobiota bacterium]
MKSLSYIKRITRVALFIATKSVRRGQLTTKLVMVFILLLTLLNLTVVGGLLNGITEDVGNNIKKSFTGHVFVKPPIGYDYIKNTRDLFSRLNHSSVIGYSGRLIKGVTLEYDYNRTSGNKKPPSTGTTITGINPDAEARTTVLPNKIVEGKFLESDNWDSIVLGSSLVDGYTATGVSDTLGYVSMGDKVRARFANGNTFEFTVVGIIHTKASTVDQRSFVNYKILRQLSGLLSNEYSEIAIRTNDQTAIPSLVKYLEDADTGTNYKNDIKEASEAMPKAIADLQKAFAVIGNLIGVTAILVGLVTVFVIIFINASSRRKQIGILKAQGIESSALVLSYIFQALFYTIIGVIIGTAVLFFFLQGYFEEHPLSLPMADGQLLLGFNYVTMRIIILMVSSLISGFIPAWLIIRQNTLDSILGR